MLNTVLDDAPIVKIRKPFEVYWQLRDAAGNKLAEGVEAVYIDRLAIKAFRKYSDTVVALGSGAAKDVLYHVEAPGLRCHGRQVAIQTFRYEIPIGHTVTLLWPEKGLIFLTLADLPAFVG